MAPTKPTRLCKATLNEFSAAQQPAYDRSQTSRGIVHLGIGAFHRAHQTVYTDDLLAAGDLRWGITGVSLRSTKVQNALASQDFLYTVQTLSDQGAEPAQPFRVVGSVVDSLALARAGHRDRLLKRIAHPDTQVITLTITESGYCADSRGQLDTANADIVHDLAGPTQPRSAAGLIALGLAQRKHSGSGPITVLSCDNLVGNGKVTQSVVSQFVAQTSPDLAGWLQDNVSFPSSMVDRIVPHTTPAILRDFSTTTGFTDEALVCAEPFSQWVIENDFAGARPGWDIAGAQFVQDVTPFEQAKLWQLNASHSTLAYLGLLAEAEYIHEALAIPVLARFVTHLLRTEITPTIEAPPGMNLEHYQASILQRFANAEVPYRTTQVAADGSQKLPQRLHPVIEQRLRADQNSPCAILAVAAWLRCLELHADRTSALTIMDPQAADVLRLMQHTASSSVVTEVAKSTRHFGQLALMPRFIAQLTDALQQLRELGSLQAMQQIVDAT